MDTHTYKVSSRDDWTCAMQKRFGIEGSIIILSDAEVIEAIIEFGRAEIIEREDYRDMQFHNDYD